MKTVIDAKPWIQEPALIPLPWTPPTISPTPSKPLKIGILWHDDVVHPHPPVTRALKSFASKIAALPNVQILDFPSYKHDEAWAITSSLYYTDGGTSDRAVLAQGNEPARPLTEWIMSQPGVRNLSRAKLEYWIEEREEFRLEYARHWNGVGSSSPVSEHESNGGEWQSGVDVVISAVQPGVATAHGTAKYWSYTSLWNLLDYPALVFPTGLVVNKDIDTVDPSTEFFGELDEEIAALCKLHLSPSDSAPARLTENTDDPQTFHGLPICLQMIGRRFEDEKVVEICRYLQNALKRTEGNPKPAVPIREIPKRKLPSTAVSKTIAAKRLKD
jgi:amidase